MVNTRVLGIVPARGGSKGIPRKNLYPIGGIPLVAYGVKAALACTQIDYVFASTEDAQIADVARAYGAETPFLRPASLAEDTTPMLDVILDTVERLSALGQNFDMMVLFQPTTPFRDPATIDQAIQMLRDRPECDSCVGVTRIVDAHPKRLRKITNGYLQPYLDEAGDNERQQRQDHETDKAYRRCGAFYISRISTLREKGSLYGNNILPWLVDGAFAVTIDEPYDLLLASAVWETQLDDPAVAAMHKIFASGCQPTEM